MTVVCILAGALAAGACSHSRPNACLPGTQPAVVETVFFGSARPGGVVSADEWRDFVAQVVTPRFPAGFTVWDAAGQWQGASGVIEREAARVLQLVHAGDAVSERAVGEIVSRYKQDFRQEAVLRVRTPSCVAF